MARARWIEIAALASLAGVFAILPIYAPQGVDFFAVAFFLLGSLLIDQRDIDAAGWTGRRPFVFACAALILAIPFVTGVCSVNGFQAQIGSGVYEAAAPPALFLVASKARFRLVGPSDVRRLILTAILVGMIPAAIYGFINTGARSSPFFMPGQPATNIAAVHLSCVSAVILILTADLDRRARILGYIAVLFLFVLGLLTASRTFIVSMAVAIGVYVFLIRHRRVLLREALTIMGAVLAISAASFFAFRGSVTRLFEQQPLGFFDGRLQTWADGWQLFRSYPVCGIGPHTFYDTSLNPLYVEWSRKGVSYIPFYHAHNILLNTLAEGGVILGVLLLALTAAAIYGCYAILKDNPENRFGQIAVALLAVFLVVGTFENTLVRPVVFPLALFLGLGMNVTWRGSLRAQKPGAVPDAIATTQ